MRIRAALACLALLAIGGCAEATATNEAPSAWETKEADPAFVRRAEAVLAGTPVAQPGWRIGVILASKDEDQSGNLWVAAVLTPDGMVTVGPDPWSNQCDHPGQSVDLFPMILSPGDLITWAGDARTEHHVCAEDMRIIRKAAA